MGLATGGARDIVADYARPSLDAVGAPDRFDEMVDPARGLRGPWREIATVLGDLGADGLHVRQRDVERLLADDGVTYLAYGEQLPRPWSLDPVPMLLDSHDWRELQAGIQQRAELLDLILTDLYGARELLVSGLIPAEVVYGHAGFVRAVDQIRIPGPRQLFLAAADVGRDSDGQWRVIADRTQAPSGAGYAMENRRVVSRVLPGPYRESRIQRLGPFYQHMRQGLQQLAPRAIDAPRVVLLTPGAASETAFDQAFLSSLLGFPLVEGADLTMRDGRVWQRSVVGGAQGLEPVDVILRRVDAWFCDPLELRPDSRLGVPGLVEAARRGSVAIVNGLGTGVLENAGLFPFLPRIAEVLLGQPLRLPTVATWWCGDELSRRHVLARLDSLVLKPISRQVARTSVFGWELSSAERDDVQRQIEAQPYAWVGQQPVAMSTAPASSASGLAPRPVLLRTFAVAQDGGYAVLPGALGRVARAAGALRVSNLEGARAKDVWILAVEAGNVAPISTETVDGPIAADAVLAAISPRVAEDLFWLGRYAERTESAARLLAITDNRWRDAHPAADPALIECLAVLADALAELAGGSTPVAGVDAQLIMLLGAEDVPGTLAHDARQLRELAKSVRDQLSGDTWAVLARLERAIGPFASGRGSAVEIAPALGVVLEALLALAGLGAESMVRDPGWHLMDAGRRVERARRPHAVEQLVAESILVAAESIITHRRRYGAGAGIDTVLQLLLLDRDNPRGVAYQLDQLDTDLRRVTGTGDGAANGQLLDHLQRIGAVLAQADTASLVVARGDQRGELDAMLSELINEFHSLAEAIEDTHFPRGGQLQVYPGTSEPTPMSALEPA